MCVINSQILNNLPGYSRHFVLVKGYEKDSLITHDTCLPKQENRKVSFDLFEKSWVYPN